MPGERPEAALVGAIRRGLDHVGEVRVHPSEVRYRELTGWTRPPGGVDIVADLLDGAGRLLMEAKVDKPYEAPWDALKLADICRLVPNIGAAYLVYACRAQVWSSATDASELFLGDTERSWSAREMVERWPRAWAGLIVGGRGIRPRRTNAQITLAPVCATQLPIDSFCVRVVRVAPVPSLGEQEFDEDGWPIGYEPPNGIRAEVRAAEERQQADERRRDEPQERDPCHGYPWYRRWTDYRLGVVVRDIGKDDDAFACLRRRLAVERSWQEHELRARVDSLRASP